MSKGKSKRNSTSNDGNSSKQTGGKKGRQRKTRSERGLPSDTALFDLAETYLKTQAKLWPDMAEGGEIPIPSKANCLVLVEDFKSRFLNHEVVVDSQLSIAANTSTGEDQRNAAAYLRFSDENSNERSLVQQLRRDLERAKQDGYFIHWEHVYADAAVTGTTAARRGYELAKAAISDEESGVAVLYIDEIGRASRDMVETMLLGQLVVDCGKRLVGVSDGLDSDSPMFKMMLAIFGAMQEWFIDQLRSKVNRGMEDAFWLGINIGVPAIGFILVPAVDSDGNPIYGKEGERANMLAIDPETCRYIKLAFRLYAMGYSLGRIARHFNKRRVGGKTTWDGTRIRQLLKRRKYVGIEVYRTEYHYLDPKTGNVVTETRPRSEWLVRRTRRLQIIPWKLWKKVQKRLKDRKKMPRNGLHNGSLQPAKALIRPICGCCKNPLWLGRSGKYASFVCINGLHGKHGCTYRGYKSVTIIENTILNYLKETIFTEDRLHDLVVNANEYLKAEAAKPKVNTAKLKTTIRGLQAKRKRLAGVINEEGDEGLDVIVDEIRKLFKKITKLQGEQCEAEARNHVPPLIDESTVAELLVDLRSLLQLDVAKAAPILKRLLGPVVIHIEQGEDGEKATWFAEFTINFVPVLAELSAKKDCPTTGSWEFLNTQSWTMPIPVKLLLEKPFQYEEDAPKMRKMKEAGASIVTIASAFNISWGYARDIVLFSYTGMRPSWGKTYQVKQNGRKEVYMAIAPKVAHLRDEKKMSWPKIEAVLASEGIETSEDTIRRAWDHAHPEIIQAAAENGKTPDRGPYRHLPAEKVEQIHKLLKKGEMTNKEIAKEVDCGASTVSRERKILGLNNPPRRKRK